MGGFNSQTKADGTARRERPRLRLALIAAAVQAIFIMSLSLAATLSLNWPAGVPLWGKWAFLTLLVYLDPTENIGLAHSPTAHEFFVRYVSIGLAYVAASFCLGALADLVYAGSSRTERGRKH